MIEISIPGYRTFNLHYLVLDYNGTIAHDGHIIGGVRRLLTSLSERMHVHIVTADTFGKAADEIGDMPVTLEILPEQSQAEAKSDYVRKLGASETVAVGNGRNDRMMLDEAALGIAVVQGEGAAVETLSAADVICPDIVSALELLSNPKRLIATLRE